jgi:nucleoside-diphosphate-sugar epimerase
LFEIIGMKLLVTGATGFVGTAFCRSLDRYAAQFPQAVIHSVVRDPEQIHQFPPKVQSVVAKSLLDLCQRQDVLDRMDCVVHLAARVHQMRDAATNPLAEFRAINTEATRQLAIAAAKSGVRRFIYLSSIKVNGDGQSEPYTELTKPNPQDPYGISKWEAECVLYEVAAQTGLEVVILRPPLIYGAGVKANFFQLMRLIQRGVPLPLGCVNNARSLLFVGNLVDAIWTCATSPTAAGQTFLVSDGQDVSTPELIHALGRALDCSVRLLPISMEWLQWFGKLTRKTAAIERLTGSLTVDSSKMRQLLNWHPPYSFEQGLQATAAWYRTVI